MGRVGGDGRTGWGFWVGSLCEVDQCWRVVDADLRVRGVVEGLFCEDWGGRGGGVVEGVEGKFRGEWGRC